MGLFSIFGKITKKESTLENYLSLVITPNNVIATIWKFTPNDAVQVIGVGKKSYGNVDNLTNQAAIAIDTAGKNAQSDVTSVVFGLSQNWLTDGQISEETAKMLKELADDLELKTQAFVSLPAALNHFLKVEENQQGPAVLVGLFKDFTEAAILKDNNVQKSASMEAVANTETVSKLISDLKEDGELPPNLIFYQDAESHSESAFEKHDWHKLFGTKPKLKFLSDEDLAKAVCYAQGADILGEEPGSSAASAAVAIDVKDSKVEDKADEFGFVEGEDILKADEETKQDGETPEDHQTAIDTSESNLANVSPPEEESRENAYETTPEEPQPKHKKERKLSSFPAFPKFGLKPKTLVILLGLLVLLLVAGTYVAGRTIVGAEVVIRARAQNQEDSFTATVTPNTSNDFSASKIKGEEITSKESGTQKAVASASKKIGEKAKGSVTVFNWTTSTKGFSGGTIIISKNGVKFTLDSDVQVASRSAATPGQTNTNVAAVELGPSGNISGGNDFTFQQFDELLYSARNDNAFTGGDEKQVTVVSQDDLIRLEKSLLETLSKKAKDSLKEKSPSAQIHDQALATKITKKEFDKKLEEEATLINLSMEVEANTLLYEENDLKDFLAQLASEDAPDDLQASADTIEVVDLSVKRNEKGLNLSGKYRAGLVPKFEEDELKEKIAGKSIKQARAIIRERQEVSDVEVIFSPKIPIFGSLPQNKSKITIKIEAS